MKRRQTVALFGVLALVGCENMGLDYAGTGEEGRTRAPTELVAAVHPISATPATSATSAASATPAAEPIILEGRRWVPSGSPAAMDPSELRSVGSAGSLTLYARQWDDAPYDLLFAPVEDRMQAYAPVLGGDATP
jgi:hypothetical protein